MLDFDQDRYIAICLRPFDQTVRIFELRAYAMFSLQSIALYAKDLDQQYTISQKAILELNTEDIPHLDIRVPNSRPVPMPSARQDHAATDIIFSSLIANYMVEAPVLLLPSRSCPTTWFCHLCHTSNSIALNPNCITCEHVKCGYCRME